LRATALFAVIFAVALAAAALVMGSRSPELVLEVTKLPGRITPDGDHHRDKAEIEFFVRESEPHAGVYIVGRDLEPIKTLDADVALEKNEHVTYLWDASADAGGQAPIGRYRLRVVLPSHDRDMVFPRRINLALP